MNLAGIRIGGFIDEDATVQVWAHTEQADARLRPGPDAPVATQLFLDGQILGSWPSSDDHAELEPDHATYQAPTGRAARPLRAFRTGPRHVTCFITEPHTAQGMSITNAAGPLRTALQTMWPGHAIQQIEHWPASSLEPVHYDEAFPLPFGEWSWRRLNKAALVAEFGCRLPR
jgi:hypothetical protein